jgi:uncharacterized RDD family membrane protein YckC
MIANILITENNALVWKRLVASLFDFLMVCLIVIVIHMLLTTPIPAPLSKWIYLGVFLIYSILFDYYQHGTPGKHVMKIKIAYTDERRSYLVAICYRDFLKALFFYEVFWLLLSPYRQGLHNRIAKCKIVKKS